MNSFLLYTIPVPCLISGDSPGDCSFLHVNEYSIFLNYPFIYAQLFIFILFLLVFLFIKTEKQLIKHDLGQKWCKIEKKEVKQRRNGCKKYKYMQFNCLKLCRQLDSFKIEFKVCKKMFLGRAPGVLPGAREHAGRKKLTPADHDQSCMVQPEKMR